jgi:adenine-specific DNA-methyltransferase
MQASVGTRSELINRCKELGIRGYSNKTKDELLALLNLGGESTQTPVVAPVEKTEYDVVRLNYIGSKYQLLDWITSNILHFTGLTTFHNHVIADLFAGTGIVSYHFRNLGALVVSNDAELYSAIITHAFTVCSYNKICADFIEKMTADIASEKHKSVYGYIAQNYSPHNGCERMFFTVENAQRIDYIRSELEKVRGIVTDNDAKFLLASLIISADAVSNVPAVYGCYLKNYKAKALKLMEYRPIHIDSGIAVPGSKVYNLDVLNDGLISLLSADIVYLDPPYNERQYSKNYFPLNMIVSPSTDALKGKTGIPEECFLSPFCRRGEVEGAFNKLIGGLASAGAVKWIFISYNSESLLSRDKMLELLGAYGKVEVVERDYKRFKSFEYNEDAAIVEYLFCLKFNKK